jgi:hypothetical protein
MRGRSGDGHAGGVLKVWLWWERCYLWRHRVRPLGEDSVVRIEMRRHRGRTVALIDGTEVRTGDLVAELHLSNLRVASGSARATWSPFAVLESTRSDLTVLARAVAAGRLGPVKAVHAVSLVAPALARIGFQVEPLRPSAYTRLLRFYLIGLVAIYNPDGWRAADRVRTRAWPAEAWMSTATLTTSLGSPAR